VVSPPARGPQAVHPYARELTSSHGDVVGGELPVVGDVVVDVALTVPVVGGGGVDVGDVVADVAVTVPAVGGGGDDDGLAAPGEGVAGAELELFGPHPRPPAARQKATRSQARMARRR
jgi:hypothetical protein